MKPSNSPAPISLSRPVPISGTPERHQYLSFRETRPATFTDLRALLDFHLASQAGHYSTPGDRKLYELAKEVSAMIAPLENRYKRAVEDAARMRRVTEQWDAVFGYNPGLTPRQVFERLDELEGRVSELESEVRVLRGQREGEEGKMGNYRDVIYLGVKREEKEDRT